MVMPMQDPQEYEDEAGNRYIAENGRYRVIRPSSAPSTGWRVQPFSSPSEARAEEDQNWQREDRQRQAVLDERRLAIAESGEARQQAAAARAGDPYTAAFERGRADRDAQRYENAQQGWRDAGGLESRGDQALRLLDAGAPTGFAADQRLMTGRAAGGFLGFLPGVPTPQQTQQLEQLRLLGSQGALGDVGQLKGPLSEKELAFIQRLQIDIGASPETNRVVAENMRWAARRQAAYGAAMERWTRELGSPSAASPNGETFDAWWSRYASQTLPRPGTPEAEALSAWERENPGREAAVLPQGTPVEARRDPASGQAVATRLRFNPETGQIE